MRRIFSPLLLILLLSVIGCNRQPAYLNTGLSPEKRAEDLLGRLDIKEKVSLMRYNSPEIKRLGIKPYVWWNEALHGVARSGLATVFPQPIGMAASFDADAVYRTFVAVSDEARAKNTYAAQEGSYGIYQGLTMWTPNINIFRDPRWGRGMETYGEDPYLMSVLGLSVVNGLQCPDADNKYDKLHACAKHFAVHSGPEWNRHRFNAENIKPRDLYETYLPAFKTLVQKGKVKEVMCAYNRFEGEPCCGSNRLLTQILRQDWGYEGIVVSDCWAISDFYSKGMHETHPDSSSAAADAVLSGTDLECGGTYKSLMKSIEKGLVKEKDIDRSVRRLLQARFELGEMDALESVSWSKIPYSCVASDRHGEIALEMARKSMTLLQNRNNILPLDKEDYKVIAVMGPNANDSVMQWGNYNGIPAQTTTLLQGIGNVVGKDCRIIYEPSCGLVEEDYISSVYNQCSTPEGPGFKATYWNNRDREGKPAATAYLNTPFNLCTLGATVFAPGVNLTDFSAIYESIYTPETSGVVSLGLNCVGETQCLVNGKEIINFENTRPGKTVRPEIEVEAGKKYKIVILYKDLKNHSRKAKVNFDIGFKYTVNIPQTLKKIKDAELVIFAGGISPKLEGEENGVKLPGFKGGDRTDIELPAVQRKMLEALKKAGKKVIYVNFSGSAIGLEPETQNCDAILQAWYPGQAGGTAVADVIFGKYNPCGHLPVTFYRNTAQIPDFENYDMTGRTYRYFKGDPLFPFGYGLSYTTFGYGEIDMSSSIKTGQKFSLSVPVTNTGKMDGDEVVQVYLKKQGDAEGPIKTLRAFRRVNIPAGKTVRVTIEMTPDQMEWWDEKSHSVQMLKGTYEIMVGGNSEELVSRTLTVR